MNRLNPTINPPSDWDRYLKLIYQDRELIVVNKNPGVYAHPNYEGHQVVSVSDLVKDYVDFPDDTQDPSDLLRKGIVHRLDADTCGLMVLARNVNSSEILKFLFKSRLVEKKYRALIKGHLYQKEVFKDYITRHPTLRTRRRVISQKDTSDQWNDHLGHQGKPKLALLEVTPIEFFSQHTLVEINLVTGRTHQIRVQLSHHGFPVIGDRFYNRSHREEPFLLLCACEIRFDHPVGYGYDSENQEVIHRGLTNEKSLKLNFKIDLPDFFRSRLRLEKPI